MRGAETLSQLLRRDPTLRFRYDSGLDVIRYLRGNLGQVRDGDLTALPSTILTFLKVHGDLFGDIDVNHLKVLAQNVDLRGGRHLILEQYHNSYRVLGGTVRFHISKDGILDTISNHLFPDLANVPPEPRVSVEEAVEVAKTRIKLQDLPKQQAELLVYRHKGKAHLVWELTLGRKTGTPGPLPQWIAYVDAKTGEVLVYYDNVPSGAPANGMGRGYYSGDGGLNTWLDDTRTPPTYQLRDTTRATQSPRGPEVITNDDAGAKPSEDQDNNWNDQTTSPRDANQGPEVDAHRYAADVWHYFQLHHGRNSWDDNGGNFETVLHYNTVKFGEFFGNIQASGSSYGVAKIGLSDGDKGRTDGVQPSFDYCSCKDWVAHEFSHAYEAATSNLKGSGESGALKEAICDIFAAFITGDWLVFKDCWLRASAPAARNMMDPTNGGNWDNSSEARAQASYSDGHSPSHYSQRYRGTWDNGGVHANAGIINHLFYLLTNGGTHRISNIAVTGIGQTAAEQMLYHCMAKIWDGGAKNDATFLDFRQAMLDACLDLFPCDLFMLSQVKNAFNAVGIGPDIYMRDNLADTGVETYAGPYLWVSPDIINRQARSTNPNLDFANLNNETLSENVASGQDNFVYVRLQNRGADPDDTTINVYFSPATTFGTPASWTHIGTLFETGIAPGSLRIAGPLIFPEALIPGPGHYCLIAVVTSALDPAPDHTCIASISDYLNFVRNSNNVAYRNLEVVDLSSGSGGAINLEVRTMPQTREPFDLQIDAARFVPGAQLRIYGPPQILDGTIARGLKLVKRTCEANIYELLSEVELARHHEFTGYHASEDRAPHGFERVVVEQEFRLRLEYVLPESNHLARLRRSEDDAEYMLSVKQLWHGEAVGAFTGKFRVPSHL